MIGRRIRGFRSFLLGVALLGGSNCGQVSRPPGFIAPAPAPEPPPEPVDFSQEHVGVQCGGAAITATPPVVVSGTAGTCEATYAVMLSVETNADDTMLMDFLQQYVVADWRVRPLGERIHHDMEVHWRPGERRYWQQSIGRPGRLPFVVHACPEGNVGPLLACSTVSCQMYDELDEVPPLNPDVVDCSG